MGSCLAFLSKIHLAWHQGQPKVCALCACPAKVLKTGLAHSWGHSLTFLIQQGPLVKPLRRPLCKSISRCFQHSLRHVSSATHSFPFHVPRLYTELSCYFYKSFSKASDFLDCLTCAITNKGVTALTHSEQPLLPLDPLASGSLYL